ncbi:normocyte binding protein 2a, putative [Perkinsus marinus ATCC 50983]|uniref:Normocyte binding protein 2a, putative n=1 Tax=Perkinsus marinus (strain ATCC 50983 / TXsc) TaxID=423536 RepID=C5LUA1_PERM5|nr:normocyte binding protein 2a, putative [Perkinsus marinus ATCC 50983]EEQ99634.1 normocyte binding protein 2a, putative [Perkinsus marinus ATCC 50983]|eukprot:XP_002766917.1 normocyte binding protein 2a, putative [Perkinsus marinus ATCC 50983]
MQEEERSSGSGVPGQSLPLISTQASLSKIEKTEISNMAAAGVFDYDQEQDDEDEVSSLDSGSSERLRRERPKEKPLSPTKALNRPGLVHVTKEGALHAQDAFKNKHSKHMDHILLTADHRAKETDLIKMKFNRKEREKAKDEIGDEGEAFVTGAYIKKQEELKRFEERLKEESKEQEGEKRSSQNFLRNLLSSGRFARSNANEADRERADEKDQEKAEALDDKQQVDEKEEKKEGVLKEVEDSDGVKLDAIPKVLPHHIPKDRSGAIMGSDEQLAKQALQANMKALEQVESAMSAETNLEDRVMSAKESHIGSNIVNISRA